MAFVTYKLENGARRVEVPYATQAEANTAAAAGGAALLAFVGRVSDDVEPGDYITARGVIFTPVAAQTAAQVGQLRGEIQDAFKEAMDTLQMGEWRRFILNDGANLTAARDYAYHQAALGWGIADSSVFASLSRTNRDDLVEHLVKQLQTDLYRWFGKDVSTSNRSAWTTTSTADGAQIYTDLASTTGAARSPDGTRTAITGATIPTGFIDTIYRRA